MKYERTGCLLVPKQICCGKDKSNIVFLLKYLLKLSGKASAQHWTEWIESEKRKGLGEAVWGKEHKTTTATTTTTTTTAATTLTTASISNNSRQNTSIYTGNGWNNYRDAILEKKTILLFVIVEHVCEIQSLSLVMVSSWCGWEGATTPPGPKGKVDQDPSHRGIHPRPQPKGTSTDSTKGGTRRTVEAAPGQGRPAFGEGTRSPLAQPKHRPA